MQKGTYKGQEVTVYDTGNEFLVKFANGTSITVDDVSHIEFNDSESKEVDQERYVLCDACKQPIYSGDLGSISKGSGFRHSNCGTARKPKVKS